jgi:DNA-binding transcriptional LysR family regulator
VPDGIKPGPLCFPYTVNSVDTVEIEVFLALADELHFGRTAARLHLPQSRVSRLIAALERRVGGKLFERTSRRVVLTPLGRQLRDQAAPAWAALQVAVDDASAAARGSGGRLRIGCTVFATGPPLTRLIDRYRGRHPGCEVTVQQVDIWDPYAALRRGEVDVLVNWLPAGEPDLTSGPVLEYRDRVLAVGHRHRLAGRNQVSAEDLGDEEVAIVPPSYPQPIADAIIPRQTPSGRPIRRTQSPHNVDHVLTLVALGRIVHPMVASVPMAARDDIVLIPIADMPPLTLGLIWRTAHENARIRELAALAYREVNGSPVRPGLTNANTE